MQSGWAQASRPAAVTWTNGGQSGRAGDLRSQGGREGIRITASRSDLSAAAAVAGEEVVGLQ